MAIEIVTPGKSPAAATVEGWCKKCRCHVKATRADCFRSFYGDRGEFSIYIICPTVYKKRRWWFDSTCGELIFMRPLQN